MNNVMLMGRLTRDPEVRYSAGESGTCIARYTLAVDRQGQKREGQPTADFISCVAFGKAAEFAEKYLKKGSPIAIEGRIQTGSYTNRDNQKVYTTEVVVNRHEFVPRTAGNDAAGSGSHAASAPAPAAAAGDGFMNIPDGIEEELPFN